MRLKVSFEGEQRSTETLATRHSMAGRAGMDLGLALEVECWGRVTVIQIGMVLKADPADFPPVKS